MKRRSIFSMGIVLLGAATAIGATATFVPVGSTTVGPGTDVVFDVVVATASPAGFDAADIVIGSPHASDVLFTYAPEWDAAFLNITGPVSDVGFYRQDVFVGGNNPSSVGTSLKVGRITLRTTDLTEGTYSVEINSAKDGGVSKLSRGDSRDPLNGSASFSVQCAAVDADCDGDFDLIDFSELPSCLQGSGLSVSPLCQRYDTDADGDVDMMDARTLSMAFTGSR